MDTSCKISDVANHKIDTDLYGILSGNEVSSEILQ